MSLMSRIAAAFGFEKNYPAPGILQVLARNTGVSVRPIQSNVGDFLGRYADQPWVYSCIRIIQTKAAGVPLKVYKVTDGKKVEVPDHPLKQLLDSVNPQMDGYGLRDATHGFKELGGNAFWLLDRMVGGRPTEIYPLNPAHLKPVITKEKGLVKWEHNINGVHIQFLDLEEVLHFKYWNPLDPFWGQAPLSAGRDASDMSQNADVFNATFFKNSAEAGGFLTTDKPLNDDAITRIKTAWAQNHQGARKAHRIEILHGGMDWKSTTMSHKDMMFPDLKRMSREDVLTCFTMPPIMVGVFDEANYSNAKEQRRIFWLDCIVPRLKAIESVINERLAKPYDDVVVEHDLSEIEELKEDAKVKAERDHIHTSAGIRTINEVRADMNLPAVPWGDTWNAPFGLAPIDQDRGVPPGGEEEEEEEEEEPEEDEPESETEDKPEKSITITPEPTPAAAEDGGKLRRDSHWLNFKVLTETLERRWHPTLKGLFSDQEKEVIANLREAGWESVTRQAKLNKGDKSVIKQSIDVILFDRSNARKQFRTRGSKLMEFTLVAKAKEALKDAGLEIDFNMHDPAVTTWIQNKAFKFADVINQHTEEALRAELTEAIQLGETIDEVSDRIARVFDIARGSRTKMIARTEVISAANEGAYAAYDQSGVVSEVEWVSSRDSLVREEHQIDGEVAPLNAKFSNGLKYPGDPEGEASNVINCRCTTAAVIKKD